MNSSKQKRHDQNFKKALSVIMMGTVCLTAIVGITAIPKPVEVSTADHKKNTILAEIAETEKADTNILSKETVKEESSSDVSVAMADAFNSSAQKMMLSNQYSVALADQKKNNDIAIKIEKWNSIKLNIRGKKINKDVPAGTVQDALAYLNIKLGENDSLNLKADTKLSDGLEIVVTNKEVKKVKEFQVINYRYITKDSDELYKGETRVESEGASGEKEVIFEETYINGKLTSKKETESKILSEAKDHVILNGTKQRESLLKPVAENITVDESEGTITDTNGNVLHYSQVFTGSSTAYTSEPGALCSTGRVARYGVVAVNPNIIPYGSILYIISDDGIPYGYAVAGDTGGFIYSHPYTIADLYFPSYDDCINYGRRNAHIYLLEGVSEDMTYTNN